MGLRSFLKQASQVFFPRAAGSWMIGLPRTHYDYQKDVGTGAFSSVVMGVVQWGMRSFPEAPMIVQRRRQDTLEIVPDHPLTQLIGQPNPFYSGELLWMASWWSWCLFGNAYWRVVRERSSRPRELWWVPPWMIEPAWPTDGSKFLTHYRYQPDGRAIDLPIEDVVHFRHGLDPYNLRLGLSPLQAVIREVWSDDEASNWVASLLRNMGVPGLILTPDGDFGVSPDDVDAVKAYIRQAFTGDRRGEPMALQAPTKVQKLSFSPSELDLSVVRDTAEERVSAALGIPAAVVGFGTGLQQTKVGATMGELRRLAWQNGLIPVQRIMAGEIGRMLLSSMESRPERFVVGWDYQNVQALQEDQNERAKRFDVMVHGGWLKVSEARQAMGFEAGPEDEIYLRPISAIEVGPGATRIMPNVPVNGNGNGNRQNRTADEEEETDGEKVLKQGSVEELIQQLLTRHSPRVDRPPNALLRLVTRLFREEAAFEPRATRLLDAGLRRIGSILASTARDVLENKQDLQALIETSLILDQHNMLQISADLERIYQEMYEHMADITIRTIAEAIDLEPMSAEAIRAHVAAIGARRVSLLNLPAETRSSLANIIEEGRQLGLFPSDVAQRIETQIPAGRWKDSLTRAHIIARTELRHSMNSTTLSYTQQQGIPRVLMFDGRLGPTDEICEARNGLVITVDEARMILPLEHPNGTLAFAPLSASMVQAMGVSP